MMLHGFIQSDVQWFQLVCCTVMLANMIIGCFSQSALGWLYLLGCKVALASLLQGGSSVNWMDLACLLQGCFSQSYVRCLQLVCCSMALSSLLQDGSIQSAGLFWQLPQQHQQLFQTPQCLPAPQSYSCLFSSQRWLFSEDFSSLWEGGGGGHFLLWS